MQFQKDQYFEKNKKQKLNVPLSVFSHFLMHQLKSKHSNLGNKLYFRIQLFDKARCKHLGATQR